MIHQVKGFPEVNKGGSEGDFALFQTIMDVAEEVDAVVDCGGSTDVAVVMRVDDGV